MAGAMRKAMVYLGLVEGEDRYDDYGEVDDYAEVERDDRYPEREHDDYERDRRREPEPVAARPPERGGSVASIAERRPTSPPARRTLAEQTRITALHPQSYNDARALGEYFRDGTPVIMNLTEMDDVDAKRLVDFAAGLVFGLRGAIDKITTKVFLLSPANVHVTAEDKARIAREGFFNQS